MNLITINIKSDGQSVKQAIAEFLIEIDALKLGGFKVLKVIHGYGSNGIGGDIKREFLRTCKELKGRGRICDFACGSELTTKISLRKMAINYCADLMIDKDLSFVNPGVSLVVLT